ncbi:hypothetical protein BDW22DRAFT_465632 [Trametopsis cervina]|nr:hypothetical protein BDW22DRAFT_465632 [Trametopsis cervina]
MEPCRSLQLGHVPQGRLARFSRRFVDSPRVRASESLRWTSNSPRGYGTADHPTCPLTPGLAPFRRCTHGRFVSAIDIVTLRALHSRSGHCNRFPSNLIFLRYPVPKRLFRMDML